MINIKPKHFESLLTDEREMWTRAQICMDQIGQAYKVTKRTKPPIKEFYILNTKSKLSVYSAWEIKKNKHSFNLCISQYETTYSSAGPTGGFTHKDNGLYLYGQLNTKADYGRALIRPETLHDKISELFVPIEIDFEAHPRFNYKYYVIAEEREQLINTLPSEFLNFMTDINGLELEFKNKQCVFRLPKAFDMEEGLLLCSIGLSLDRILNKK